MASDLYVYLLALPPHWWVFLTSGPASLDRVLRNHWAAYAAWMDKRWDQNARARIFRRIAFAGLFLAGFLAFRDEHRQLIEAQQAVDKADNKRERKYPLNYHEFANTLHDKINPVLIAHPGWWVSVGYVDNPSSVKVTEYLIKSIRRPSTTVSASASPEDDPNGEGITLVVRDPKKPTSDDQKIIDAFRSSGFVVKLDELDKDPAYSQELFGIYISYPPFQGSY